MGMTVKWYVQCSRGCSDVLKTFISTKRKSVKENINKLLRLYKDIIIHHAMTRLSQLYIKCTIGSCNVVHSIPVWPLKNSPYHYIV